MLSFIDVTPSPGQFIPLGTGEKSLHHHHHHHLRLRLMLWCMLMQHSLIMIISYVDPTSGLAISSSYTFQGVNALFVYDSSAVPDVLYSHWTIWLISSLSFLFLSSFSFSYLCTSSSMLSLMQKKKSLFCLLLIGLFYAPILMHFIFNIYPHKQYFLFGCPCSIVFIHTHFAEITLYTLLMLWMGSHKYTWLCYLYVLGSALYLVAAMYIYPSQ